MATALYTALSALKAHQSWIDVLGNNLANTNTTGFKSSAARFSDHFFGTLKHALAPNNGLGGRNPAQIGQGVSVGTISRDLEQGSLTDTGRTFDLAMQGHGYFALSNGTVDYYTRAGSFGLDSLHNLVDLVTGYSVLAPDESPINIDTESMFPPKTTENVEFAGNLPADVSGPLAEVLTGASGMKHGYPAELAGTVGGMIPITVGENWTLEVEVNGGAPQQVSVPGAAGGVSVADIAAAIDALDDVSAAVNGSGFVQITSNRKGGEVTLKVNPGEAGRDLSTAIGMPITQVTGTETELGAGTTLNDLPANLASYVPGDVINVSGVDADGATVDASFRFGSTAAGYDGETVDEFVSFIDNLYPAADVSVNAAGQIVVEAQTPGESDLLLSISDHQGQTGRSDWSEYATSVTTEGTGPDTVITSTEIYDAAGVSHTLTVEYERQGDLSWNVTPRLLDGTGEVLSGTITGLQFDEDGTPIGLGAVNDQVVVQFDGDAGSSVVSLDFGTDGGLDGLTEFGAETGVFISGQDGYGAGELANLAVETDGTINGYYTNGQIMELASVGVATFGNEEGLSAVGDNLWGRTPNSGSLVFGKGDVGPAGRVMGGALENSNVDTAEQFVRLIEAQRGYQASSRVISVQDEVLAEAVNLI